MTVLLFNNRELSRKIPGPPGTVKWVSHESYKMNIVVEESCERFSTFSKNSIVMLYKDIHAEVERELALRAVQAKRTKLGIHKEERALYLKSASRLSARNRNLGDNRAFEAKPFWEDAAQLLMPIEVGRNVDSSKSQQLPSLIELKNEDPPKKFTESNVLLKPSSSRFITSSRFVRGSSMLPTRISSNVAVRIPSMRRENSKIPVPDSSRPHKITKSSSVGKNWRQQENGSKLHADQNKQRKTKVKTKTKVDKSIKSYSWSSSSSLHRILKKQANINANAIFGPLKPVDLQKIFYESTINVS